MDYEYKKVLDFVIKNTKHFDDSHNFEHAIKVYNNAMIISKDTNYDKTIIMYAALLHDVCDHKYPESIPFEDLVKFIRDNIPTKADIVIDLINNVSFSKEVANKRAKFEEPYNTILDIISDADRLEALGEIGITRCIEYTRAKNPSKTDKEIMKLVIDHCHEKLLRLYTDNYIKTKIGRELAKPLHVYIENFIKISQMSYI